MNPNEGLAPELVDDAAVEFQQWTEQSAGAAAAERMLAKYGSKALDDERPPEADPEGDPAAGDLPFSQAGAVAGDIARGVTEAPQQIVGGIRDAAQATYDLVKDFDGWMREAQNARRLENGAEPVPASAARLELPEVGAAETTTGGLVRGVTQFLTGFVGAGKITGTAKGLSAIGKTLQAMLKGAVADFTVFDGHQERLSNLVQKFPELQNPVSEFLAADTSDSEIEGRVKNAIEGLGLGAVTDGFLRALKVLRQSRIAQSMLNPTADAGRTTDALPVQSPEERAFAQLGDPAGEALFVQRKIEAAERGAAKLTPGAARAAEDAEPEVFINFARIEAPEDIQKVMQTMADANAGTIRRVARGTRTWEQTKLSADQQNAWKLLMERRRGEPLNAEQSLAARQLWVTSATKLSEIARIAAETPSEANLFTFRKMLATHYAIQSEVVAARTETARALNAWKIPAGEGKLMGEQLDMLLEQAGGTAVNRELAQKVAALSDAGMAEALESMVKGSVWARTNDAVAQVWINALLTNPATHVVNAMSNWSVALQQIVERRGAAYISQALGTQGGVELAESTAMASALVTGFGDALRASWRTVKTGESAFLSNKVEVRPGALSAETWSVSKTNPVGMALNVVDVATRTPGRLLGVGDEFFKTIGYRMELAAQAARTAAGEAAAGRIAPDAVKARAAEITQNPPENIRLEAVSAALYNTFTSKPAATLKAVGDAIHKIPILGRLLLPFKNTPINILTYAAERSPMAPAVRQWRMDVAAGGARRDIALSRIATGSMVMASTIDLAMSGTITGAGPAEPNQRQAWLRAGNQPYSIKINDKWYSYGRLDPIGMTMGMAADIAEAMRNAGNEIDQKDFEDVLYQSTFAVAGNVLSKTYMRGLSEFFNAITRPQEAGSKYFQRLAGSFIPAGEAAIARQVDPYMRTAETTVDALRRRIPGLSADLPAYRDLWGRPVDYRSGQGAAYDLISPIYIKTINPEPIDTEIQRLGYFPSMPDRRISINGVVVELDGKQYSRFVELAGNGAKHPAFRVGAKDFLNQVLRGDSPYSPIYKLYSDGPDGGKADFIRAWIADFRERAKQQMLAEDGGLKAQYEQRRKESVGKFDPAILGQ